MRKMLGKAFDLPQLVQWASPIMDTRSAMAGIQGSATVVTPYRQTPRAQSQCGTRLPPAG